MQHLSFKQGHRRLAFSAFMKVDLEGKVHQVRFEKTIVRNAARMSYEEAQAVLDGEIGEETFTQQKGVSGETFEGVRERLGLLRKIALARRRGRNHSELFDKNEVVFELDSDNLPVNIGLRKRVEAEKIVEEFMIMTNCQVAQRLVADLGVNALLIHHPRPLEYNLSELNHYISGLGVKFKYQDIQRLPQEFEELFESEDIDDGVKQLLILKAIQIQELATYTRYRNTFKGHFGLNLEYYTHFTSPLRRFADFVVHEQLQMCLAGRSYSCREVVVLEQEIACINNARLRSKKLKQRVVECFINLFLHHKGHTIRAKGFIVKLGLRSATIYVPTYNLIKEVPWQGSTAYAERDTV